MSNEKNNLYFFERGLEQGRKEVLEALLKLLDIDERIAKAVQLHEDQSHNE